jgi:colanic acid/amylovoran biosynthesis glycosyltransferase
MTIAYVMTWFPKLTETFVLDEILALKQRGVSLKLFPLIKNRRGPVHLQALALLDEVCYQPFVSLPILCAHWHYLRRKPGIYWRAVVEVFKGTARSPRFLFGALCFFPKTVRMAYEMEQSAIAHVHAHFASNPALAVLVIHRLTGIPYSFTAHGSDLHVDRTMLAEKLRSAAFAVTVSGFNERVMVTACGKRLSRKIHVIHCGVDTQALRPRKVRTGIKPFTILCVASLVPVKGHRHLIEACQMLARRGIPFRCHLVGEGPLRARLVRQIAAAALSAHFELHGGLPRHAVARLLTRADVFVLASVPTREGRREGIPVALMEAMAAGLPVVASDLSGIPELVEHGISGLLVEPRDCVGLADAMQRLSKNRLLREAMGRSGRERVLEQFDLATNVARLASLFDVALAARQPVIDPASPIIASRCR